MTMIKKSILFGLLSIIILSFTPLFLQAEAPPDINLEYYSLHNLIENGDFSLDSNSDGLADGLTNDGCYADLTDGIQYIGSSSDGWKFVYFNSDLKSNSIYYFGFRGKSETGFGIYNLETLLSTPQPASNVFRNYSFIFDNNVGTGIVQWPIFYLYTSGSHLYFDNVIVVNLTLSFGAGNEPSLSDFETYYLPDGYFEDYNSYRPSITETVEGTEITVDEQLDWTTALISKNGGNIDLNIYMYLDDPDHYFDYPFALNVRYYGITYDIDWIQDENNHNLFVLDLSDPEENAIVKEVLFDRSFSDNYLSFLIYAVPYIMSPSYWIDIESNFIYNVNIGGAVVSTRQGNLNDTCPLNSGYLSFYDAENNRINPSLILDQISIDTNQLTKVYDSFSTKYNSVSSFRFSIDDISYEGNVNTFYGQEIYELGVFAVNSVILIDGIDIDYGDDEISIDDIDQMFPIKVYEWYDIGGQLKNLFNYVGKELYMALPIQSLIDSVTGFVDYLTDFSTMLPPEWWAVIGSVVGLCFLGLALHLAEKWL